MLKTLSRVAFATVQIGLVAGIVDYHIKLKAAQAKLGSAADVTSYLATMIGHYDVPVTDRDLIEVIYLASSN